MLTSDFADIIEVVMKKIKTNTLETLSPEDIKNVSLMLLGYLQLIKTNFKTPSDSKKSNKSYYEHLKSILNALTQIQTTHLEKIKRDLIDLGSQELQKAKAYIKNVPTLLNPNFQGTLKEFNQCLSDLNQCTQKLKSALKKTSNAFSWFHQAMLIYFECSAELSEIIIVFKEQRFSHEATQYLEIFQKSLTFHAKKILYWDDLEKINNQCNSYINNDEFIDLLMNN